MLGMLCYKIPNKQTIKQQKNHPRILLYYSAQISYYRREYDVFNTESTVDFVGLGFLGWGGGGVV